MDSDERRIGHDETVLSDSALLEVTEICTYKSDILSSAAQGQHRLTADQPHMLHTGDGGAQCEVSLSVRMLFPFC